MRTLEHENHLESRSSHNDCNECRADCERVHVQVQAWPGYRFVGEYLSYIRPRLEALKYDSSVEARIWHKDFLKALNRRITLRAPQCGRKYSDSYIERLKATRFHGSKANHAYLIVFAKYGASTLKVGGAQ